MSVAAISIPIPTTIRLLGRTSEENLVRQSRGLVVVLLSVHVAYTFCQMATHRNEYYHTPPPHDAIA